MDKQHKNLNSQQTKQDCSLLSPRRRSTVKHHHKNRNPIAFIYEKRKEKKEESTAAAKSNNIMTLKRKVTDESSSGSFQRNVNSSRFQCLEGTFENYKHIFSEAVNRNEDADRLFSQIVDLMSRTRNTVDAYYPKSNDGGEVVAMGTEDTNACGLLEGPEGGRLFGKYHSIYTFFLPDIFLLSLHC